MAPFVAHGNLVALASEKSLLFIDISTNNCHLVDLPPAKEVKKQDTKEVEPEKKSEYKSGWHDRPLSSETVLAFSNCGKYLAACTWDKSLTLWSTEDMKMVHQWEIPRKSSSICFSHKSQELIVADKAGDCYAYSYSPPCEKGTLLLGHLSMLLDSVVSEDDKFIITSERDEKIRVSCFPNAYNIHSFCLGHTEFVSTMALLPSNLLLSGSGDATVRLWDFVAGKELHCETIRSSTEGDMEKAVRSIVVNVTADADIVAAVLVNKYPKLLVFTINTDALQFKCQEVVLDHCPLAAVFTHRRDLYVLTDDVEVPLRHFQLADDAKYTACTEAAALDLFHADPNRLKTIQDCIQSCEGDMKPLYKRWFDNVQEFRDKKNERLAQKADSKSAKADSPEAKKLRVD